MNTMPQLPPDLLRTFIAAADTGSFTRASEVVHRTQAAISMKMKRLEEELGRTLFLREGRGVVLTAEGEMLYRYARRLLSLHDEALNAMTGPVPSGVVRLGAPEDYAAQFLPNALKRFADAHPAIDVEVHCDASPILRERFDQGELDVVLTTEGYQEQPNLRKLELVWVKSERVGMPETTPLPLALFHDGCLYRRSALDALERAGITYRITYGSPSLAGVLAAVHAGLAVAPVASECPTPGCRRTTEKDNLPELEPVAIGLQKRNNNDPATASLHEFISREMGLNV